jgi:hypothetical protein
MPGSDPHAGIVTCPTCDLHVQVTDPNEAIELYRRHNRVTGHDVEWERVALDVTASSANVESALADLEHQYSEGVPVGVLAAAVSHHGVAIADVVDGLYDLRMEGAIYEPADDHFRVL